jgi:hypothetical protein
MNPVIQWNLKRPTKHPMASGLKILKYSSHVTPLPFDKGTFNCGQTDRPSRLGNKMTFALSPSCPRQGSSPRSPIAVHLLLPFCMKEGHSSVGSGQTQQFLWNLTSPRHFYDKGTFKDGQTDIPSQSEGNLTVPPLFYDSGTFNGGHTDIPSRLGN